jgi:Subtilase family
MRRAIHFKRAIQVSAVATILAALTAVPAQAQTTPAPAPAPAPSSAPKPAAAEAAPQNPVKPLYGNIDPFYRDINAFWGNISPFYGNIDPFWGNISPFYGNISPFWGNIDPFTSSTLAAAPAWGNIQPFWQDLGGYWNTTNSLWGSAGSYSANPAAYTDLAARLDEIVRRSQSTWGAAVTSVTGKSFAEGFANPLFAKYGIDPNNPASLATLSAAQRSHFFMDWYDGLMGFSGHDRPDHWMKTVNWSPAITQQQGYGTDTLIGLLDSSALGDADIADNIVYSGGSASYVGGHGAGVASLMVAAHDGSGVMGIAPNARVAMYNPFDANGSANWNDVRSGIIGLKSRGASIINMSLGIPGTTLSASWREVFGHTLVDPYKAQTIYVLAAGNDGLTQTQDIEWKEALATAFLVVGSVDPSGNISSFSNRPGTACLLDNGVCKYSTKLDESGLLMYRFLVAPGELMLVADGQGGVTRRSGTSFAAPLVSGTIALLHDRWPWLKLDPKATQEIILRSARDLGAPGVDTVYGWGMLDVAASQSPLDFSALKFYQYRKGRMTEYSATQIKSGGVKTTWEADGVYFVLFETVGSSTRDFVIPMSSKLSGSVSSSLSSSQLFQRFITTRLTDWIKGTGGFTDVASYTTPANGGWRMSVAAENPSAYLQNRDGALPHSAFKATDPSGRFSMTMGYGSGAMALGSQSGFGLTSDYASDGGINPLLSLASGGNFFGADFGLNARTTVSFGFTDRTLASKDNLALDEIERRTLADTDPYEAEAMNLRVTHRASDVLTLSANYTRLREKNALLAVQTLGSGLDDGSTSESATLGASLELPHGITLAGSATAGRSRTNGQDQALTTTGTGARTSAYAFSASKLGVLGGEDMLRLSVAQPLHIEKGAMNFESVEVIDRQTGEIGVVNHRFSLAGRERKYTGEFLYAAPVLEGQGELSLFGRADVGGGEVEGEGFVVGGKFRLDF